MSSFESCVCGWLAVSSLNHCVPVCSFCLLCSVALINSVLFGAIEQFVFYSQFMCIFTLTKLFEHCLFPLSTHASKDSVSNGIELKACPKVASVIILITVDNGFLKTSVSNSFLIYNGLPSMCSLWQYFSNTSLFNPLLLFFLCKRSAYGRVIDLLILF